MSSSVSVTKSSAGKATSLAIPDILEQEEGKYGSSGGLMPTANSKIYLLSIFIAFLFVVLLLIGMHWFRFHVPYGSSRDRIFVYMIWRHGDRTAGEQLEGFIINDTLIKSIGYGQLTELGEDQAKQLGRNIRARYFDGKEILTSNAFIRSTNVSRTIKTAINILKGMEANNISIDASIPLEFDSAGNPFYKCSHLGSTGNRMKAMYANPEIDKRMNTTIHAILRMHNITTNNTYLVSDIMKYAMIHSKRPEWMTDEIFAEVKRVSWLKLNIILGMGKYRDEKLSRLQGGPILQAATEQLEKGRYCGNGEECLYFYGLSAHDITIVALLSLFSENDKYLDDDYIEYGGNIAFELWRDVERYYIKVLLANRFDKELITITRYAPGCKGQLEFCEFDKFIDAVSDLHIDSLEAECSSPNNETIFKHKNYIRRRSIDSIHSVLMCNY